MLVIERRNRIHHGLRIVASLIVVVVCDSLSSAEIAAEDNTSVHDDLVRRLERAEAEIQQLKSQPVQPEEIFHQASSTNLVGSNGCGAGCSSDAGGGGAGAPAGSSFYVDYDKGFVIRPYDKQQDPFELKVNARMQYRYNGFRSDGPTPSRNNSEIERGRIVFRGFAYDPALQYFINIDADTDENHVMKFHDFWVNYNFSDAFNLYAGKGKVTGSYTWYDVSIPFRFVDRDVATTFFRTDRTIGVWARGDVGQNKEFHYQALVGNGLRSTDLEDEDVDDLFAYSLLTWWDPFGDIGKGFSDLKWHECLVVRVGQTFAFANQNEGPGNSVLPEARWVRLGNGTRLTDPGALAPGVTVAGFNYYLYTAFLVAKYQGWSANTEFYYRWINNFDTVGGASPHSDLEAHGFYTDIGYMIVPKSVEVIGRISGTNTSFGDTWEYAGGVNWYINGTHNQKIQFDVSVLDDLPTSNTSPNFEVGQTGILYRLQYQLSF